MSFRSVAAKNVVGRMAGVMTIAGAALVSVSLTNESSIRAIRGLSPRSAQPPNLRLPDESIGIDGIARTLISVFDQADIVALGEAHQRKLDSDLRIALVRHPDFPKKVRSIVVEFASTTEQPTLDRYIRGESVSRAQLEQVWKTTTQAANGVWDDPIYPDFFAAVRDVNSKLPADARIRVFGGDPGPGDNLDRGLNTQVRPVLVPLQRLPFRDFAAEEFSGPLLNCRGPGGCVNVFKGSTLTLGQIADACVYVGGGADVDTKAMPTR